eukprot:TRINITY_DN75077_c0_g1_i1.p1 TRINITY_DN75077_c0_g1~~TRINITY_DN75077_c0_g1_i1.p1  ORF type:complete len:361 (+),score=85.41 TRINITY_DN75077_c0_g1_i1:194-1276(+)
MAPAPEPPKVLAGGRFETSKVLGEGCFGTVYSGVDKKTGTKVAVKYELKSNRVQGCLALEYDLLQMLHREDTIQGFAQAYYFGREGPYTCMVMDLLGKSLEDHVEALGGKLNVKSTILVAEQALLRIEYLHSRGILHRDIKPENFMFGIDRQIHHMYLIDFGLSTRYWSSRHVEMTQRNSLTGTVRYASINSQRGLTQSRRDDLEAIGHMMMYCLRGSLPWSGLKVKNDAERSQKIREKKESVPLSELCNGFPEEFQSYLLYCRNLAYRERPDYAMLRGMFSALRQREGPVQDHDFQWLEMKALEPALLVPVDRQAEYQQPEDPDEDQAAAPGCCLFGALRRNRGAAARPKLMLPEKDTE